MGYTHYWSNDRDIPRKQWDDLQREVRRLIAAYPVEVDPEEYTSLDEDAMWIGCYEDFVIGRRREQRMQSCKTGHCKTDKLVCAVLSVVAQKIAWFSVSSDAQMGSEPNEWPEAVRWASGILGYEVKEPWEQPDPPQNRSPFRAFLSRLGLG